MKQLITTLFALVIGTLSLQAQNTCCGNCQTSGNADCHQCDGTTTCQQCDSTAVPAKPACIFNGSFICEETGLRMFLNLDEETIDIPGMSFLGPTNGYLDGTDNNHVYGVWMLLKFSIEGDKVKLRFTNDIGSDSQDIVLTRIDDNTFDYVATGSNAIRKVEGGRKLVKIPSSMRLHRVSQ